MSPGLSGASDRPRRADLRLFGFAAAMWAASLTALQVTAGTALVGVGVTTVLAVVGAGLATRRPRFGWMLVAVLVGVVCGGLSTAARTAPRDADPLASLARDRAMVRAELTVSDDPVVLSPARAGPVTYLIPARLARLEHPDAGAVRLDVRILVFATGERWRSLLPGQLVRTAGRLAAAQAGDLTAAVQTAVGEPELVGRPSWAQLAAGRLRAGLQLACDPLPAEPGGLLPGLVIGDTSRLDPALEEEFRTTGLTHLVAVSGANVAIVLGVVLFAARWCRAGPWLCAAVCGVSLMGFVILARPSPSVVRAAAMGGVGLLALVAGRSRVAAPALAAAVIAGLAYDPALAVDAGFALSVLATGGLVLLAPRWRDGLRARGVPAGIAEALAVPAAAQVACGPVIAGLAGGVSLVAVPANLLAAPAVAPATLLGVGAALISPLWSDAAEFVAWLASWPAAWLVAIAHTGARVPSGSLPWPSGVAGGLLLAALTAALLVAGRRRAVRRVVLVVAVGATVGAMPVRLLASGWPPDNAVIVACDVGQGDAIVLPIGEGEAVVVDAGPDPVPVDACLRRLGVQIVSVLVMTHFHADHIGGLSGVLRGREVHSVAMPAYDEPATGEAAVRKAAAGKPIVEVAAGWRYARGGFDLRVLGPTRTLTGTRSDPNNNSLVLRVISRGVTIVLAADAENEAQHDLLRLDRSLLRADVFKLAHHGSPYQDQGLLDAVDPAVVLVSVGADNQYGHPNPALLNRLERDGARVLRTDIDGDIAVAVVMSPRGLGVAVGR